MNRPSQPALPTPQPGRAELPPMVQQACRALGLKETPLAFRQTDRGGLIIITADGRKLCWTREENR